MKINKVRFYIVHPKRDQSAIYLKFYFDGKRLQGTTGISIPTRHWDQKKKQPKATLAEYHTYKVALDKIEKIIREYYASCLDTGKKPSEEDIWAHLKDKLNGGGQVKKAFFGCIDDYIQYRIDGKSAENSLKIYGTMRHMLTEFQEETGHFLSFERITKEFEDRYRAFLMSRKTSKYKEKGNPEGLLNGTMAKHIYNLKNFMGWALERGYHTNEAFKAFDSSRKNDRPRGSGRNDIIVLTELELQTLKEHDFSDNPRLANVRDVFLFATYTAQRWGDVQAFKPGDIVDNKWEFTAKKTKEIINVPLVGWCAGALEVLAKHGGNLPKMISEQKFNKYIKEACKAVGITREASIQRGSGKELLEFRGPKYEFISSHCARRTAITILCTRGMPLNILQQLTGHDDIETLMKYVTTPKEELANWLSRVGK